MSGPAGNTFGMKQLVSAALSKGRKCGNQLYLGGAWMVEHFRQMKSGTMQRINVMKFANDIVNVGRNLILNVMFFDATQIAANSWFSGLISNASYSALNNADTMSSHGGWTEFTSYSQSTRPLWGQGSSTSQSMTNSSPIVYSINGSGTVKGLFITSNSTKSGTTGTLWATALFTSDAAVVNTDELRCTYVLNV